MCEGFSNGKDTRTYYEEPNRGVCLWALWSDRFTGTLHHPIETRVQMLSILPIHASWVSNTPSMNQGQTSKAYHETVFYSLQTPVVTDLGQ